MNKILNVWRQTEKESLNETTYSRVSQKIEKLKIPFVIVSADRNENSSNENSRRNKLLKQRISEAGYPFAEVLGSWVENKGQENENRVIENSVIIYDEKRPDREREANSNLFDLGKQLCSMFEPAQDGFIFGETGSRTGTMYITAYGPNGEQLGWAPVWRSIERAVHDEEFWSKVRGSHFKFSTKPTENENVEEKRNPRSKLETMRRVNEVKFG